MRKLGFDLDGVFCNFTDAYSTYLTKHMGMEFPPCSDEFPKSWNWDKDAGVTAEQCQHVWTNNIMQEGSKFWLSLAPMDNALETLERINELAYQGHDVYFLTNRLGDCAKYQTEKWLQTYGIDYPTVLLTDDKLPLIKSLGIDFFIDDKPSTIESLARYSAAGQLPTENHIYLKNTGYNQHVTTTGIQRVNGPMEALTIEKLWRD